VHGKAAHRAEADRILQFDKKIKEAKDGADFLDEIIKQLRDKEHAANTVNNFLLNSGNLSNISVSFPSSVDVSSIVSKLVNKIRLLPTNVDKIDVANSTEDGLISLESEMLERFSLFKRKLLTVDPRSAYTPCDGVTSSILY